MYWCASVIGLLGENDRFARHQFAVADKNPGFPSARGQPETGQGFDVGEWTEGELALSGLQQGPLGQGVAASLFEGGDDLDQLVVVQIRSHVSYDARSAGRQGAGLVEGNDRIV